MTPLHGELPFHRLICLHRAGFLWFAASDQIAAPVKDRGTRGVDRVGFRWDVDNLRPWPSTGPVL